MGQPRNLHGTILPVRHSNAVAAGTTDIEPATGVDMAGFKGCYFIVLFGTITATAVTSIKVQSDTVSTMDTDPQDLTGTSITVAADDDNQMAIVDVWNPRERYLRCVVDRGTANAVVDGIIAIKYGARKRPVTLGATVVASEFHQAPAEGTA
jgi:hypothetical protein